MASKREIALGKQIQTLQESNESFRVAVNNTRALADERSKQLETQKQSISDLKQRLQAAETANQYMRGYLARVQEDDLVREELLTVDDPAGDQQLVPKRKPTQFQRPDDFTYPERTDQYGGAFVSDQERRKRAKHWIAY